MFKTTMSISPGGTKFSPLLFVGDWQRGLDAAISLGYDAIELSLRDPQEQVVKHIGEAVQGRGFAVSAVSTGQSYYNDGLSLASADPTVQAKLRDRLCAFVEVAAAWRAFVVIGGVRGNLEGDPSTYPDQRKRAVEAVQHLAEYAESCHVGMLIEPINRYETRFINTVQEALQFIADVGADNLCVLADSFHMNIEEACMGDALRLAGKRLGYVHLSDSNRKAAGQGHTNLKELATVLRQVGYSGYIGAEILPLPDDDTAARMAIAYFRSL
jgi:sugar phosphate isomerase/epimerase